MKTFADIEAMVLAQPTVVKDYPFDSKTAVYKIEFYRGANVRADC